MIAESCLTIKLPDMNWTERPLSATPLLRDGHTCGDVPDNKRNGYFISIEQAEQVVEALQCGLHWAEEYQAEDEVEIILEALQMFMGEKK